MTVPRGDSYDARFLALSRRGVDVHGEAAFVDSLGPGRVLDAGCGTGRVAVELARRGHEVAGVDLDPMMLDAARQKAPELDWHHGDLSTWRLDARFDRIVLAGNVMLFLDPGSEGLVVANLARHLAPGGLLVAGFQLRKGRLDPRIFDGLAAAADLELVERWSTWDRQRFDPTSGYQVSVHRLEG
ncbi:MAG: class I SAM-dependent methyltransferase [Acidimicrobiia bacterium]